MQIQKCKINSKIILLIFKNQFEITSTFLRFQEHYESPKFRGKIFTLAEFKKWYTDVKGRFSYYTDWNGFNIPSQILQPFYSGKFNPLSVKEEKLLQKLQSEKGKFYVIGIHKDINNLSALLKHEIAHGLFYTDKIYKKKVLAILQKFNLEEIKRELKSSEGYHDDVLDDEVHAYSLDTVRNLQTKIPQEMKDELLAVYNQTLRKNNISLEKFKLGNCFAEKIQK